MHSEFRVTRLSASPVGAPAPDGERGDIVQVSDGATSIYLSPDEYDAITLERLRYLIYRRAAERNRKTS
jgi:hypothetical protein